MGRPKIYEDASEDRVTLRINKRLRKSAEQAAETLGQSLNFWIAKTIENRLTVERGPIDEKKKAISR